MLILETNHASKSYEEKINQMIILLFPSFAQKKRDFFLTCFRPVACKNFSDLQFR